MPEELVFDNLSGEGPAIDGNKGLAGPLTLGMDQPRDDLLPGAAFPGDEDCRGRLRNEGDRRLDLQDCVALADKFRLARG